MRSLEWALHPLKPTTWLDEIWGVDHHLVSRGSPGSYSDLFSAAALEDMLVYTRPDESSVRIVRKAEKRDLSELRLANGSFDIVQVRNDIADGFTVVLNGLEWHVPAVAEVAHALEVELEFEVQVNAYLTPPGAQGFLPHYDDHDVLVMQVEGSKLWHLYDGYPDIAPRDLKLREAFVADALPPPTDLKVNAGDLLYVPRGRVHAAEATDEPSLHLTFGIHPPTLQTVIIQAVDALTRRDDRLAGQLPPRYLRDPEVRFGVAGAVAEVVGGLADHSIVAEALGAVEDSLIRRGRALPAGRIVRNTTELGSLDDDALIVRQMPLHSRVLALDGGVALQFAQSLVAAGSDHREAMLFLSRATAPFRVGDLPGLSTDQRLALVRKLMVDGFLLPAPE